MQLQQVRPTQVGKQSLFRREIAQAHYELHHGRQITETAYGIAVMIK